MGFKEEIRIKERRKIKVCIVDDNVDNLEKLIEGKIDCSITAMDIKHCDTMFYISRIGYFRHYDLLFFDATYRDDKDNVQAISIAEKLMVEDPSYYKDIVRVFIGKDVIDYARVDDFEARDVIGRTRELPHVIYGDGYGTKVEKMINQIQAAGRKNGIDLPIKMQEGNCRTELLKKIQPYKDSISACVKEQGKLSIGILEDLKGFEPTNEVERCLIDSMKKMSKLMSLSMHNIGQIYKDFNINCSIEEEKAEKSVQEKDKQGSEPGIE